MTAKEVVFLVMPWGGKQLKEKVRRFCGRSADFALSLKSERLLGEVGESLQRENRESSADAAVPHAALSLDGKAPRQSSDWRGANILSKVF